MDKVRIRFIKDHFSGSGLKKGDEKDAPKEIADGLIKDGFCELVKKKKAIK